MTVYGNGGDDTFDVGNTFNSLDDIQSAVTIYGGAGTGDKININDQSDAGLNGYTVNGTSLTRVSLTPPATVTVNYEATLEELVLNADGISTGVAPAATGNLIDVTASQNTKFTIHGNNPAAPNVPGDTLSYSGPLTTVTKTLTGTGSGTLSDPGGTYKDVVYDGIETLTATGTFDDVITVPTAVSGPNLVTVKLDSTSQYLEIYLDEDTNTAGGEVLYSRQLLADVNSLTINGSTEDDQLVIDGVNGLPVFAGDVPGTVDNDTDNLYISNEPNLLFNGGAGNDSILFQNLPTGYNQTYAMGEGDGGGRSTDPNGSEGEILTVAGTAQLDIYFMGLEPVSTSSPGGGTLKVFGDATNNNLFVVASPTAGYTRIEGTAGAPFEYYDLAVGAFTNLEVYGMDGIDRVELRSVDPDEDGGLGELATIRLDGDRDTNDDPTPLPNIIAVRSTSNLPGSAIVRMYGGPNADGFLLDSDADGQYAVGTVDNIRAQIQVAPLGDNEGGGDELYVIDTNGAGGKTVVITDNTIDGITGLLTSDPDITYTGSPTVVTTVKVFTSNLADRVDVNSTAAGPTYYLATQGGDDEIYISSDTTALTAGNLDTILGRVRIDTGADTAGDELYLSDYNDGDADVYTVTETGSGQATAVRFNGVGPMLDDVVYNATITSFGGFNTINAGNAATLERFYLIGSNFGGSTYNIDDTTATASSQVDDGDGTTSGASTFNIQADALEAGSDNTFNGFDAADTFNVNYLAAGVSAANTFVINGYDPANSNSPRDTVSINTNASGDGTRNVEIIYDTVEGALGSGDVTVNGLGTAIDINTVERLNYNGNTAGAGANDDVVTVRDFNHSPATAGIDPAVVSLVNPNSARYTRGVGGTSAGDAGPDLNLAGLFQGATPGLVLDGNAGTDFPGDHLLYNGPAPATKAILAPGAGTISAAGVVTVGYQEFERIESVITPGLIDLIDLNVIDPGDNPGPGTPNAIRLVRATLAGQDYLQVFVDDGNGGGEVLFSTQLYSSVASITVTGNAATDRLIVDHGGTGSGPEGGLLNRAIFYNAGGPANSGEPNGDSLAITGNPGFVAAREVYTVGASEDAGTWLYDQDATDANGNEMVITFTGLEPADTDSPAAAYDVVMNASADWATISNGGSLNGFDSLLVTDNSGTFESHRFARKDTVRIMGNNGADAFRVDFTANADGSDGVTPMASMELYGNGVAGFPGVAADDAAGDEVQLNNANVPTLSILTQDGLDYVHDINAGGVFNTGPLNLDGLVGTTVNIDMGENVGDYDVARLQDFNDLTADTNVQLTSTTLTNATTANITYSGIETLLYEGSGGADNIFATSTALGTYYYLTGNGDADVMTIGNDTLVTRNADGSLASDGGSLTAIQGEIMFFGEFNPASAGAVDTLNVDASNDGNLANVFPATASVDINPAYTGPVLVGSPGDAGAATELLGFAPAAIRYRHTVSTYTTPDAAYNNRVENVNIFGSDGADTIFVGATTATVATHIDMHIGNDFNTMTIDGDDLSAANVFHGSAGNDQFILNITAHLGQTAFAPITALEICGDDTNLDSNNRDRLIINDNNAAFARDLNWDYLDVAGLIPTASIDILASSANNGLFGGNDGRAVPDQMVPLNVRSMETVLFNSTGADDLVRVTGTAADDIIAVAAVPDTAANAGNGFIGIDGLDSSSSAMVFLNGNPYLASPGATLPADSLALNFTGMAGGGAGPDVLIDGVDPTVGIRVDGEDADDNRAVYQAASELAVTVAGGIDYWGLGAGVLIPGFGASDAWDDIAVNQVVTGIPNSGANRVSAFNTSEGSLLPIELTNLGSFVQTTPVPPRPGLIVNAGDEAGVRTAGLLAGLVADDIWATAHAQFNIQVNGNLPPLVIDPISFLPVGDQLHLASPSSFSIWSDKMVPPNVSVRAGNDPFEIRFSSIERTLLTPGNGAINLIGDQNNPAIDQTDHFVVVGRDIDFPGNADAGYQEATVVINRSAPIMIQGMQFLNVYGFDAQGANLIIPPIALPDTPATGDMADDIDTLEITAYADNTPRGWGVHVNYNEGVPNAGDATPDGVMADLLMYHTSLWGGAVSEGIVIQPSAIDAGQLFSNNAATGTPIVVIDYMNNTDILVDDNDGFASDTDTLTLRGMNPDPAGPRTGQERVVADFTQSGDANTPLVQVFDGLGTAATGDDVLLYRLISDPVPGGAAVPLSFNTINFSLLGGDDVISVIGRADGSLKVNVDGGNPPGSDTIVLPGTINASDAFTVTPGATSDAGVILSDLAAVGPATTMNFVNIEAISIDGGGGTGDDAVTVNGTGAGNAVTVNATGTLAGNVRVDAGPLVSFANLGTGAGSKLAVNTLGGDDAIVVNHAANWNLPTVAIDAGAPNGSDSVRIVGDNTVNDTFTYTSTGPNAGNIVVNSPSTSVTPTSYQLTDVEAAAVDGRGQTTVDTLAATNVGAVITPSGVSGSGTVTATGLGGIGLLPLSYTNIENPTATGTTAVIVGTSGNDIVTVALEDLDQDPATALQEVVRVNGNPFDVTNYNAVVLNLLGGNDSVAINPEGVFNAAPAFIDIPGGLTIIGGDSGTGGGDSVAITNRSGNNTVGIDWTGSVTGIVGGAITLRGVESLSVSGVAASDDTFNVTNFGGATDLSSLQLAANSENGDVVNVAMQAGPDYVQYMPLSASTGSFVSFDGKSIFVSGLASTTDRLNLNTNGGTDTVVIEGSAGDDTIWLTKPGFASTEVRATRTGWLAVEISGTAAIVVDGNTGDDQLIVDESGGLIDTTVVAAGIAFHGGDGRDTLRLQNGASVAAEYSVGLAADAGSIKHTPTAGGASQTVTFTGLEPVIDTVAGALTVTATNAANAINVGSTAGGNGLVSVDGFETIEFANKTTLTVNALAGSDTISINNPAGLTGGITVNGGDGSDVVRVLGTPTGGDTIGVDYSAAPATVGSALVTVNALPAVTIGTAESLEIDGQGGTGFAGDTLTVTTPASGRDDITLTPGVFPDAGSVVVDSWPNSVSYLPLTFHDLDPIWGSLVFADAGASRSDLLTYVGTPGDDGFSVNDFNGGQVGLNGQIAVYAQGVNALVLKGQDGNDVFNVQTFLGALPFDQVVVMGEGGEDDVSFQTLAGTPNVQVDNLAHGFADVTGGGLGLFGVQLNATEFLNIFNFDPAINITVDSLPFGSPETYDVTPISGSEASIVQNPGPLAMNVFVDTSGALTINESNAGDGDTLVVHGTTDGETIIVDTTPGSAVVQIGSLLPVNFTAANIESLRVLGEAGDDTFNVTSSATIPIFIDGGDPIGLTMPSGDRLSVVTGGGSITYHAGPENDEGGIQIGTNAPISFDHIENLGPFVGASSVSIYGTDAADSITIIARDASYDATLALLYPTLDGVQDFTVAVNDGPEILFIDVPALNVYSLGGSDEIAAQAPAPNGLAWNVNLTLDGGLPTASDQVIFGTPGQQSVQYTPTAADGGTLVIANVPAGPVSTVTLIQI